MNNDNPFSATPDTSSNPMSPVSANTESSTPPPIDSMSTQTDPIAFVPEPIISVGKKSKLPLIISAIVGVVLIAGGVFATLWFINFTKPEAVALDAMTNFLNSKAVQAEGNVTVQFPTENNFGLKNIKLELTAKSSILPSASTGKLIFATQDDEISIDIESVILIDGRIYFKLDRITELLEAALPEEFAPILEHFETELADFNGEWHEFDIVEVAKSVIGIDIETDDYDCTIAAFNSLNSDSVRSSFVEAYKQNPFIAPLEKISGPDRNGGTGYNVNLEFDTATSFFKHLTDKTTVFDSFESCFIDSASNIDTDEYVSNFKDNGTLSTVIYASLWDRQLRALAIDYATNDFGISINLDFSFPESIDISAPTNAKSFSDFLKDVLTKVAQLSDPEPTDPEVVDGCTGAPGDNC